MLFSQQHFSKRLDNQCSYWEFLLFLNIKFSRFSELSLNQITENSFGMDSVLNQAAADVQSTVFCLYFNNAVKYDIQISGIVTFQEVMNGLTNSFAKSCPILHAFECNSLCYWTLLQLQKHNIEQALGLVDIIFDYSIPGHPKLFYVKSKIKKGSFIVVGHSFGAYTSEIQNFSLSLI